MNSNSPAWVQNNRGLSLILLFSAYSLMVHPDVYPVMLESLFAASEEVKQEENA